MKKLLIGRLVLVLLFSPGIARPYEIPTHQKLSEQAVNQSVIESNGTALENIGLKPFLYGPNDPRKDENQRFPTYGAVGRRDIFDLVMDGAGFEDDHPRWLNHFYDPIRHRPLTINGLPLGDTSPDWALEDRGNFSSQENSYRHAREYFYSALTTGDQQSREVNFGRTFEALGHMIHHIQDMAQPQHVRNEAHPRGEPLLVFTGSNFYEHYTDGVLERLPFGGYAPVQLYNPRAFWGGLGDGRGIADFTNFNFVTEGTNFTGTFDNIQPHPSFNFPQSTGVTETPDIQELLPNTSLRGKISFIGTNVTDNYDSNKSGENQRASSYSIFTKDLQKYNAVVTYTDTYPATHIYTTQAIFTLNRFNFDAAHQFLIPRAVGYSAGMINYFFRGVGQMDVVEDPTDPNRLLLQNLSDETLDGTFTLYYDDADGNRSTVPGGQWIQEIPGRGEVPVAHFPPPSTPAPKEAGEYLLVFKGTMGQETDIAVAATLIHPPAPESFLIDHRLSLTQDQTNQWVLTAEEDLQYGATNWIGEAGVLSYGGPTRTVYRGGRVLAVAPDGYYVSAAALQPDPDNPPHARLVALLVLPSGTTTTTSVWVKALSGTHREWQQQFTLNLDFTPLTAWRFNQAGTKACAVGSRTTSHHCTFTLKDFGSYQYPAYDCTTASTSAVIEVDMATGTMTDQPLGSSTSIFRSDDPNHAYDFYSGTAGIGADYRNNVRTVATSTSTSENEFEGSILKGVFPYWQRSSYRRTVAIDGAVYFSSSGFREENWRWLYTEGIWEGSGMVDWTEAGFAALDLRGPWFVYTTSHQSGTATDGNPITESPGRWTTQSSFELGTNRDGVLSTDNGTPSRITWALDRQGNVAFSLKVGEDTWINRLNNQDLGALTELTGEIPAIGIR